MPGKKRSKSFQLIQSLFYALLVGFSLYVIYSVVAATPPQSVALAFPAAGTLGDHLAAPNLITGTVVWKETDKPAANVRLVVSDQKTQTQVTDGVTDQNGNFMLLVGVGTWLVDIPTGSNYFGYGQLVTVMPHVSYTLDFAITQRPLDPPTATPGPTNTPTPLGQPSANTTPVKGAAATATAAIKLTPTLEPGSRLPRTGQTNSDDTPLKVYLVALSLMVLGLALRGLQVQFVTELRARDKR